LHHRKFGSLLLLASLFFFRFMRIIFWTLTLSVEEIKLLD
jgi:hypothetical protein